MRERLRAVPAPDPAALRAPPRPAKLNWLTVYLVALGLGMPAQIMIAFHHAPWEWRMIAAKMEERDGVFIWEISGLRLLRLRGMP